MNEHPNTNSAHAERVNENQRRLGATLANQYDFIVCGSGSAGSVVAGRLAANPDAQVLLLEAGQSDETPSVFEPGQWATNIGSDRDWGYHGEPSPVANGRRVPLSMGKALGGGSSINAMAWVRGHMDDWNHFAAESGNDAWNYENVLKIYRRIEDWHGAPDPKYRGIGGPVFVQPAPDPHPLALAALEGAANIGIPTFENANGRLLEADCGGAIADLRIRDGKRESVFRSYTYPLMDRPNLTVLTNALVMRVIIHNNKATGVQVLHNGETSYFDARAEVVLSLGTMHTPKVLMQSGVGDTAELRQFGITVNQHLAGVGRNFQDHVAFQCVWESGPDLPPPHNNMSEAIMYAKATSASTAPDMFVWPPEVPMPTVENATKFGAPGTGWTIMGAIARPKSRGRIRLTGPDPFDRIRIEDNFLSHPDDFKLAIRCVEICREIGNSAALRSFARREAMPGNITGADLEDFVRDAATTFWHEAGTAKMGRDEMSVVDGNLRVYGVENLRIADASVMPRVTTANTMAPSVVIGERAADTLMADHGI